MSIITTKSSVLEYITDVMIVQDYYENGALYIALYDTIEQELYTDLSTYIMPVLPCEFFVEVGTEKERFVKEHNHIFFDREKEVKQGFNRYHLYIYNGFIH